jgi:hypothetical protein
MEGSVEVRGEEGCVDGAVAGWRCGVDNGVVRDRALVAETVRGVLSEWWAIDMQAGNKVTNHLLWRSGIPGHVDQVLGFITRRKDGEG